MNLLTIGSRTYNLDRLAYYQATGSQSVRLWFAGVEGRLEIKGDEARAFLAFMAEYHSPKVASVPPVEGSGAEPA